MILDRLSLADRYTSLHPGIAAGLACLRRPDLAAHPLGRHSIDGERLIVIVARDPGRGKDFSPLESHRKYIDLQYVIEGTDLMGYRTRAECAKPKDPFSVENDIGFYWDEPESWFEISAGGLAIFFPEDAHAPLAGNSPTHKAVVKVAVNW